MGIFSLVQYLSEVIVSEYFCLGSLLVVNSFTFILLRESAYLSDVLLEMIEVGLSI